MTSFDQLPRKSNVPTDFLNSKMIEIEQFLATINIVFENWRYIDLIEYFC